MSPVPPEVGWLYDSMCDQGPMKSAWFSRAAADMASWPTPRKYWGVSQLAMLYHDPTCSIGTSMLWSCRLRSTARQ